MAPSSAERALHRQLARLSRLAEADRNAILTRLPLARQRRIAQLLGTDDARHEPAPLLSPWLASRIRDGEATAATRALFATLAPAASAREASPPRPASLLSQAFAAFAGRSTAR